MTLPPCVSSAAGVRTEQDLYARLIDSVTKQVGQLSFRRPSHRSLGQQLVTQSPLLSFPTANIVRGTKQESRDVPSAAHA